MKVVRCGSSPEDRPLTLPVLMSSLVVPPASGVNTSFDSPKEPWQEAHFSSNSSLPRSTLPEPWAGPRSRGERRYPRPSLRPAWPRPTPFEVFEGKPAVDAPDQTDARIDLENLDIGNLPRFRRLSRTGWRCCDRWTWCRAPCAAGRRSAARSRFRRWPAIAGWPANRPIPS